MITHLLRTITYQKCLKIICNEHIINIIRKSTLRQLVTVWMSAYHTHRHTCVYMCVRERAEPLDALLTVVGLCKQVIGSTNNVSVRSPCVIHLYQLRICNVHERAGDGGGRRGGGTLRSHWINSRTIGTFVSNSKQAVIWSGSRFGLKNILNGITQHVIT